MKLEWIVENESANSFPEEAAVRQSSMTSLNCRNWWLFPANASSVQLQSDRGEFCLPYIRSNRFFQRKFLNKSLLASDDVSSLQSIANDYHSDKV